MKNKLFISILVITGFWGFLSIVDKPNNQCVNVYIDFGSLDNNKKVIGCIAVDQKETALTILEKTGVKLDGTEKYGLQVVCRVDGLPGPKKESCATMPPENAYWAVIVKNKSSVIDPIKKWGWADKGVSELYLKSGDSVGLVFTENGKVKWPD